jgi:hypothetical protein
LREIAGDLAAAEARDPDLPKWSLLSATDIDGVVVERYAIGENTVLLFAPDRSAPAITYQTWFSAHAGPSGDPRDVLEPAEVRSLVER